MASVPPGDIQTQPANKIVFNAPYDDKHTYHIKIINSGGHRIGWAIKTTNMKRLGVDPPAGVLDPKEAVLMAVSCDAFAYGQEDTNNDRITIEWTNTPDGAAKQFRREWFQLTKIGTRLHTGFSSTAALRRLVISCSLASAESLHAPACEKDSSGVEKLKELLQCPVCYDSFGEGIRTAKLLKCAHTFCIFCLERVQRDGIIKCPTCQKSTTFEARESINTLNTNFQVMALVDHMNSTVENSVSQGTTRDQAESIDDDVWLKKCQEDGVCVPSVNWRPLLRGQLDYRLIHQFRPFNRNLVPQLRPGMDIQAVQQKFGWKIKDGGSGMTVESPPDGCQTNSVVSVCFATSFQECSRHLVIDFEELGISEFVMDRVRPSISITEMVAPRHDCGSKYRLEAVLIRQGELYTSVQNECQRRLVKREWPQWTSGSWEKVEIVFDNYPSGVRQLHIISTGADTQFWKGYYGAKFANTSVILSFPVIAELNN